MTKVPMAENCRPSRKSMKERISGVSVKLENPPDARYGQSEKNPSAVAEKKQKSIPGESEKDSGFSDTSSEYLSTVEQSESEDRSAPAALNPAGKSTTAQSSLSSLTPVYFVKNVIVKEPLPVPTGSQLVHTRLQTWENQHSLGSPPGQTRVVFIRQPLAPSLKVQKAEVKTGAGKDTYLPILNSYPRIAPHPNKDRHRKENQEQADQHVAQDKATDHKSKRLCVDEMGAHRLEPSSPQNGQTTPTVPLANWQGHWQVENSKQQLWFGATNALSHFDVSVSPSPVLSPDLTSQSECSESSSSSCSSSVLSCAPSARLSGGEPRSTPSLAKQRRFRNTVEILNRSGLLEITLRTKELIRQNGTTQRQINELKEHAQLFCSAVRSRDPLDILRLQEAMKCSGAYEPAAKISSSSTSSSPSSTSSPSSATSQGTSDQAPLP
ncbi:CLOCK-interacting pacemaker [Pristis pectinata]|uniref:CLOCK-interacting pacemaker n=1 Tax=Pristis pectinata TaxID=685728 RepID=UPI00223E012D|nr:CLOCK-interacting pacemaker [Pristis pectinata]